MYQDKKYLIAILLVQYNIRKRGQQKMSLKLWGAIKPRYLSTTAPRRRGEEGRAGGIYSASTATVNSVEARKAMSQDFAMSHQSKEKHSQTLICNSSCSIHSKPFWILSMELTCSSIHYSTISIIDNQNLKLLNDVTCIVPIF